MIIDRIVLHNFGVFAGRHSLELSPPSETKPLVLVGGLNGAGKTTLLEALQLALYGKLAIPARDEGLPYEEYLARSINSRAEPSDGASVEVTFRSTHDGEEHSYRVCRSWAIPGRRLKETVNVFIDDRLDAVASENWTEQVERFIPARLAHLFFFDGERIEALADPDRSAEMLSTAIQSLLGVDLVERLETDLVGLERRKSGSTKTGPEKQKLESLEGELSELQTGIEKERFGLGRLTNELDRAKKVARLAQEKFVQQGGERAKDREKLELKRSALDADIKTLRGELIEIAYGSLPLAVCSGLLEDVATQSRQERELSGTATFAKAVEDYTRRLILDLKKAKAEETTLAAVKNFGEAELEIHAQAAGTEPYMELAAAASDNVAKLLGGQLGAEERLAADLITRSTALETELEQMDRILAAIPDDEAVASLLGERDTAFKAEALGESTLARAAARLEESLARQRAVRSNADKLLFSRKEADLQNQDTERVIKYSGLARETLAQFRTMVVKQHATRLQSEIVEGFRRLLRKRKLIADVRLDPETTKLELLGPDGSNVEAGRLSAGERQLLAVSMLWGLGKAAGRPLPAVIDTPLGRLDKSHRKNLVENYFPFASHQVILLSTDEEITEEHYKSLEPWIGRSYRIEHDDATSGSSIKPGYFWSTEAAA